jgi:hypothetical protein
MGCRVRIAGASLGRATHEANNNAMAIADTSRTQGVNLDTIPPGMIATLANTLKIADHTFKLQLPEGPQCVILTIG